MTPYVVAESLKQLGVPLEVLDASETFYSGTTIIRRRDGSSYETAVQLRAARVKVTRLVRPFVIPLPQKRNEKLLATPL